MKIWIDILTPKQLLFAEIIIKKLGKKHNFLCTSRRYGEVLKLAKIRNFDLNFIGKYGGETKEGKFFASVERSRILSKKIKQFSPELILSFCSPEAARISFGLGIRHIAFCDSPHAEAVMKLTLPLINKLLIPKIIPKNEFVKYGINPKNIITYNTIDASVIIQRKTLEEKPLPFRDNLRKNILIRLEEEESSYAKKSNTSKIILHEIMKDFPKENVVVLARYPKQIQKIKKVVNKNVKIIGMSYDGKFLLKNTDIFIGSGGTMVAEAALLGIPTISYNAVPNRIEKYLVKMSLVKRTENAHNISSAVRKILATQSKNNTTKIKNLQKMRYDPIQKLIEVINE